VVEPTITTLLQIYQRIFGCKNFENRLRFDRTIATTLVWLFLAHPVGQILDAGLPKLDAGSTIFLCMRLMHHMQVLCLCVHYSECF